MYEKPDVIFLYQYYGLPIKKVGSSLRSNICPACGANSDKSHKVILSQDRWYCFRCGEHGNGYEFIKKIENVEFKEAAKIWDKIIGNDYKPEKVIKFKKIYKEKTEEDLKKELELKQELIRIVLKIGMVKVYKNTAGWEYLVKVRNISEKVLEKYINQKFFIIDTEKVLNSERVKNLCKELELNYKIFTKREIIFPFFDEDGKGIGAEFRTVEINTEYPKTISLGKKSCQLWQDGKYHNILICEGFIDALSARALNWNGDILVVPGVSHAEEGARLLKEKNYKKIYSAFDPDEAGLIAVQKTKEIIKKVKSLKLPKEKDLNDIIAQIDNIFDLIPETFWDKVRKKLKIA